MNVARAPGEPAPQAISAAAGAELKRKRSLSDPPSAPQKTQKPASAHLAINYLARQFQEDLPLISNEDSLPSILNLLNEYQGVLERHESLAFNLGARPLGPILIKRFERLFDGPPRVLKNHGKDGNSITWLDVVEFARNKPEQFVLGQMSEGVQVCQIHLKQMRVQISEEDYLLIKSGMPQKLIPPQPIVEDEERELGTLEILDKNLSGISHLADQVAARTRQLKHRMTGRRNAILERRANEPGPVIRGTSPSVLNGSGLATRTPDGDFSGRPAEYSKTGASASTKNELLGKFLTQAEKERRNLDRVLGDAQQYTSPATHGDGHHANLSLGGSATPGQYREIHPRGSPHNGYGGSVQMADPRGFDSPGSQFRPPPASNAPGTYGDNISVHSFSVPASSATAGILKEVRTESHDGPFRAEMVARVEGLRKGDRVLPPCDRCRRLHMDCIKNLTACAGCTKKHAKCSWRDVRESELWGPDKGKVAIPAGPSAGSADETEREASLGARPDHASVQLLQAFSGHGESSTMASVKSGPTVRDARLMAVEGLSAAEQQSNGHGHSSEQSSPLLASPPPPSHSYASRPASSAGAPQFGTGSLPVYSQPYDPRHEHVTEDHEGRRRDDIV